MSVSTTTKIQTKPTKQTKFKRAEDEHVLASVIQTHLNIEQ